MEWNAVTAIGTGSQEPKQKG
jgi:hypothetical protein